MRDAIDLTESFNYALCEGIDERRDFIEQRYGPALVSAAREDTRIIYDVARKEFDEVLTHIVRRILDADPTPTKKYAQWIARLYAKRAVKSEDFNKAFDYLQIFDLCKHRLEKRDINAYGSFQELFKAIEPYWSGELDTSSAAEKEKLYRKMHSAEHAKILYDDSQFKLVVPLTKEASCYFGRNTQWCTAATRGDNYFDSYNRRGPLYVFIDKKNNLRWQFHFESQQFMNESDSPVKMSDMLFHYPILYKTLPQRDLASLNLRIPLRHFDADLIKHMVDLTSYLWAVERIFNKDDFDALPKDYKSSAKMAIVAAKWGGDQVYSWFEVHLDDEDREAVADRLNRPARLY